MAGLPTPDSLVAPFGDCLTKSFNSTGFKFPEIGEPGMPPIIMGAIGAMLGPAKPILDFIPPNPDIVPDITDLLTNLPSVVAKAFVAKGLPQIPIEIPGVGKLSVGDVKLDPKSFDSASLIKFVQALILAPINIFKGILESLIELTPKFPDLSMIKDILNKAFATVGIPADVVVGLVGCLGKMFMEVITAIIP